MYKLCGISGVFSFKNPRYREYDDARDFLQQAMFVGTVRGYDSTGLLTVTRKKGEAEYVKQAIDGSSFLGNRNVQHKFKKFDDYSVAIVHNRKATHGLITDGNAHPFTVGHITLVHNGGISLHRRLPGASGIDVDSEAITAALNTVSPSKAKNILSLLDGAFVLLWHDDRDNTINLARNDKRPLTMAYHEKEDLLYFCSEKKMLDWLLDRTSIEHTAMFDPKPNQHFKWDIKGGTVKDFSVKKFEPYKSPVYAGTGGYRNNVSTIKTPSNDYIPTLHSLGLTSGQRILFEKYEICSVNPNANRCTIKGMSVDFNFETIAYNVTNSYVKDATLFSASVSSVNQRLSSAGWATITLTAIGKATDEELEKWMEDNKVNAGGASKKLCEKGCDILCPECRKDVEKGGVGSEKKQEEDETEMARLLAETENDYYADSTAYVQGPKGMLIQQSEFDDLTKHGCSNCSADLLSPNEVCWTYMEDPLCRRCDSLVGSMWANFGGSVQ